jgi:hypothetical protein
MQPLNFKQLNYKELTWEQNKIYIRKDIKKRRVALIRKKM